MVSLPHVTEAQHVLHTYAVIDCFALHLFCRDGLLTGCAFIVFSTRICAQNAIHSMHHSRILEVSLVTSYEGTLRAVVWDYTYVYPIIKMPLTELHSVS